VHIWEWLNPRRTFVSFELLARGCFSAGTAHQEQWIMNESFKSSYDITYDHGISSEGEIFERSEME
jgi:hypothetical protein